MKKSLFLLFLLASFANSNAQCWKMASYKCGIKTDASLWAWGEHITSSPNYVNNPVKIGNSNWKQVDGGYNWIFAIKTDGTLWTSLNGQGQPADPGFMVQVGTDNDWKLVASNRVPASSASNTHSVLAIKINGTLWAWGSNTHGQLGDGTNIDRIMPVQIGASTNWKTVSIYASQAAAIKTDGTLWEWGIHSINRPNYPLQTGTDNDWNEVKCGAYSKIALKNNGTIWEWGEISGGNTSAEQPRQIGTDNDWAFIGETQNAIKSNGTFWTWGIGGNNIFFGGTLEIFAQPVQMGTDNNWAQCYYLEEAYSSRMKTDGTLWDVGNAPAPWPNGGFPPTQIVLTTNCPEIISIVANNDTGSSYNGIASTAVANILSNDTYNSLLATFSNVSLTFISATNSGITLNPTTGAVNVTANVPVGSYTLTYKICDLHNVANCATGTVVITVKPQTIDAITDNFTATPINTLTGGVTPSVLSNDTLNGQAVNSLDITTTLINNGGILDATISSTGEIYIPVGTLVGSYTMSYRICSNLNPELCDNASLKIRVNSQTITTPDIVYATRANNRVFQSALQSTGKIIISGSFSKYNNIDKMRFARLNNDLTLDTSFFTSGPIPNDQPAYEIAIQPNNKIILVGNFISFNGSESGFGIARLNADGTPDLTFNFNGTGFGPLDSPRCIAIQPDGKILIGGPIIRSYNGIPIENIIRLNSDGSLDTTFNFHFKNAVTSGGVHKILLQPNGKIIVSGNVSGNVYSWDLESETHVLIAEGQPNLFRLNSNGSLDTSFIFGRTTGNSYDCGACISVMPIQNLLLQPDGKIIAVGIFDTYRGSVRNNIFRINSDGSDDTSFSTGTSANRTVKDAILEPSGKIVIAGVFTDFNGISQAKLARLNSNGSLDTSFSSGIGPTHNNLPEDFVSSVYDLNRQLDGKIIVSGYFTHYNGISATNITRIAPEVGGGQAKNSIEYYAPEKEIDSDLNLSLSEIKIYPNPSNGIFTFDFSNSNEKFDNLTIYNTLGQIIYQSTIVSKTSNQINLSNLSSGTYIAKIHGENTSVQKILIKK